MILPLRDRWAHRVHLVHCRPWGITVGLRSVESESIVKCKSQVEVLFRIFWLRRSGRAGFTKGKVIGSGVIRSVLELPHLYHCSHLLLP